MTMYLNGGLGSNVDSLGIRFNRLPVLEAEADEQSFVCEFTGTAGANETGVGGGLTGADLVLTQVGNVPGAADGGRKIMAQGMYFMSTVNMLNAFVTNEAGFSIVHHGSDLVDNAAHAGALCWWRLLQGGTMTFQLHGEVLNSQEMFTQTSDGANKLSVVGGIRRPAFPVSGEFWHIVSVDFNSGLGFVGIAVTTTLPQTIREFVGHGFLFNAARAYTTGTAFDPNYKSCVASSYPNNPSAFFKIMGVTCSKTPFVVPA